MKIRRTILSVERLEDRCTPATWGNPWPDAAHLTLSFAPDGTQVGSHSSNLFQTLNAVAPTKTWQTEILRAFQTWAAQANINLTVVPDSGLPFGSAGEMQSDSRFGDIRIAAFAMPPGAEAIATPFALDAGTWSGAVQLNSSASFGVNGNGHYDLFSVVLHEASHVFGFGDNSDSASVMDLQYLGVRSGLGASDVTALQALYGGPRSPDQYEGSTGDNQFGTATRLGSLANLAGALAMTADADITTLQDRDYYSFNTLLNFGGVDVTLRTAGISLLTPRVTVYDAFGRTIVSAVTADPVQGGLAIHLANVSPLSTYYIKVQSGQNNVFGIGSYELTVKDLPLVNNLLGWTTATVTQGVGAVTDVLLNVDTHTNDSFATATALPSMTPGPDGSYYESYRASLSDATDVDYYKLQAPPAASGSTGDVLTAMVWGMQNQLAPLVRVFDSQHNLLAAQAAQVLVNDGFSYVVQIANAVPQATYYVEVLAANPSGGNGVGNYFLGVDSSSLGVALQAYAGGTLTSAHSQAVNTLKVDQRSQFFHFVLSGDTPESTEPATVQMTIIDAVGRTVFTLAAGTAAPVTGNVSLDPGTYTVLFSAGTGSGRLLPDLSYQLLGETLTDPQGPEAVNPTGNPAGSSSTNPNNSPTWTGGSSSGVSSQPPSSNPYSTANGPAVVLSNPGDQNSLGGDGVYLVLSASDRDNHPLAYTATGLPPGLTIDVQSGVVSGTIANNAAGTSPYVVTVTATDNSSHGSATQTFYWYVYPPVVTLTNPGGQTSCVGATVQLSLSASATDHYPLTFSAAGLPPGLSIDSNTGVISGTIADDADTTNPYEVTITVTDPSSGVSVTVIFHWMVSPRG